MSERAPVNFADIYLQAMRDRGMRSGTELAREFQLTDWSTAGNLSNRSSGVQIPRDICTRFGRYLYSTKCSWIIRIATAYHASYFQLSSRGLESFIFDALFPYSQMGEGSYFVSKLWGWDRYPPITNSALTSVLCKCHIC